jgi:branched-chain amino acid aminotransferase
LLSGDGSKTCTFFAGEWHERNIGIMGPGTHAAWLCSIVFDDARAFEGVSPVLDLHCARVNESAKKLSLKPIVSAEEWIKLAREGVANVAEPATSNNFMANDGVVVTPIADGTFLAAARELHWEFEHS